MIAEIRLENFKRFRDLTLNAANLTVLTGANGAGKTSVLHSLLLARQMARQPDRSHVELNGADALELGGPEDVIHHEASDDDVAAVEVLDTEGVRRRWSFRAASTTDTRTLNAAVVDRPDDDSGALAGPAPRFSYLCAERLGPRDVLGACADFVTEESEHVGFFRSVILWENADEAMFERLAQSAFPALEWADGVWRGLGHFSRPYIEVRDELVRCLGGLGDHGAACFHEHNVDPRRLSGVLSARVGSETSDENGNTKSHKPSERDRTRRHPGINKVFWWHVKLRPHVDRIHFLYESPSVSAPLPEHGRIVIGLFKDHCILPS